MFLSKIPVLNQKGFTGKYEQKLSTEEGKSNKIKCQNKLAY